MKKNVLFVISILLLILAAGTFFYLNHQNTKLEKEVNELKENINKVEETIKNEKQEITEKEDEYAKLKEKVKDNMEELGIWENLKEELNKSLS